MLKEKPILFNGDMVRAILDGRKTQTRRVVKDLEYFGGLGDENDPSCYGRAYTKGYAWLKNTDKDPNNTKIPYPYGKVGDRLWVRESHAFDKQLDTIKASEMSSAEPIY